MLHCLLDKQPLLLQRILVPPVKVIPRSLRDSAVIQAIHYIRFNACKGIKTEQVLHAIGMSRSNLEKRFCDEIGDTIHAMIHREKPEKARELLASSSLNIDEISQMCGYPLLQYLLFGI